MTYNMSNMEESSFKKMVAQTLAENPETEQAAAKVDSMTIEDIEKMLNIQLSTKEAEDENGVMKTYVDIRPMMAGFIANGSMDSELMSSSRQTMEKTIESIGSTQMKSMGIAFAVNCDTNAGIDVHNVQIKYLWAAGAKMIGMTMLMGAAAILLGYMASRVGAGVGRDLREKTFKQVVSFSNAEMDKFSTASLITRSTNDIQQIQMVISMMLRMILYAPVLGIGGIIKVINTGANMGWIIVLAVIVILGFVMVLMSLALPKFKLMQKLVDKVNLVSREILTGLSVIRAFGREKLKRKGLTRQIESLQRHSCLQIE